MGLAVKVEAVQALPLPEVGQVEVAVAQLTNVY
jgi:hypothetical protein